MRAVFVLLLELVVFAPVASLRHAAGPVPLQFEDVATSAGLAAFRHVGGSHPDKRYIPEVMSGGVCAFDFDADGWTDVFFVNGGTFQSVEGRAASPPHALFRNRGDGTFADVTEQSRIRNAGWGMGCAAADYDNDGRTDLYVTNFHAPNQLWRNAGRGAFEDVTARTRAGGPPLRWNTGATFGDYDGDGDLDLFVAGYVALDLGRLPEPDQNEHCRHRGIPVNCGPRGLPGQGDLLLRNDGDGTFTQVDAAGRVIDPEKYYGLGAAFLQLDADGPPVLFVANDSTPNALYRYRNGTLVEEALKAGVALSEEGNEQAGMGIAWGDYDSDGRLDLYVTNFVDDYNTLYGNAGDGLFEDVTRRGQLAQPTWLLLGWGTAFADFDRDAHPDLVVTNGHVYPQVDALALPSKYRMPVQVFRNEMGKGTFTALPEEAVPGRAIGRGLAVADFWNDGRLGFAVNNLDGSPALYRSTSEAGRFLELLLEGEDANRSAIGARVTASWPGGRALRVVASGGSYLSSHDARVHFGVGDARAVSLEIRWPDGTTQRLSDVATDRIYRLRQGERPAPLSAR